MKQETDEERRLRSERSSLGVLKLTFIVGSIILIGGVLIQLINYLSE